MSTIMGEFKLKDKPDKNMIRIDFTKERRRPAYVYIFKLPGENNKVRIGCDFEDEVVLPRETVW